MIESVFPTPIVVVVVHVGVASREHKGFANSKYAKEVYFFLFLISDIFPSQKLKGWEREPSMGKSYLCCFFLC